MPRKRPTAPLTDSLDQVHQWLDIAFEDARALSHTQLAARNHVLTGIFKLKRELAKMEEITGLRQLS